MWILDLAHAQPRAVDLQRFALRGDASEPLDRDPADRRLAVEVGGEDRSLGNGDHPAGYPRFVATDGHLLGAVDLHLEPNAASDLCPFRDREVLEHNGWELAYVTVLDDTAVENAVALLGHRAGEALTQGWSAHRIRCVPTRAQGKTEDAEACARWNGAVYVVGSQYGSGDGPLQPKRAFLARLREEALRGDLADARPILEVARNRFLMHRAINEALCGASAELPAMGKKVRKAFVEATIRRGEKKGKSWVARIDPGDVPINIEAASFRPDGTLLLGLRYPCTADGEAILIELEDVDRLIDCEDAAPRISGVWTLHGIGSPDEPVGFGALHTDGDDVYEAVVGNLDSRDKDSALLDAHPEAGTAMSEYMRFRLPQDVEGGLVQDVEQVLESGDLRTIEGLATAPGDKVVYVADDDRRIHLRFLALEP